MGNVAYKHIFFEIECYLISLFQFFYIHGARICGNVMKVRCFTPIMQSPRAFVMKRGKQSINMWLHWLTGREMMFLFWGPD